MKGIPDELRTKARTILKQKLGGDYLPEFEEGIHLATLATLETLSGHATDDTLARKTYNSIFRRTCQNLLPEALGNNYLLNAVRNGEIDPIKVASLKHTEMFPDAWAKQVHQENTESTQIVEGRSIATTSILKCGKCGSNKITYTESQQRSADEAMTVNATCTECGKKWKQ